MRWFRRLAAPAVGIALPLVAVVWAWPVDLPFWRSLGIVAAWTGSGMLAASLVLMVRAPRFAASLGGLEAMYLWHHRLGGVAYLLLLTHPLALAAQGWTESPQVAWQSLAPWVQAWPEWLGWAALLMLMLGLATTFALRLSYRRWRTCHYLLALAVMFGFAHVYVLLGDPWPLLAMIVPAGIALAWRFLVADLGLAAYPYRVAQVERRGDRMIEALLVPCASALPARPGQFVLAAFGDGPHYRGCGEAHPFSVSGVDARGSLRISVKALGPCSGRLQHLEPGVMVRLQGPFGRFLTEGAADPQLWVAGGVGITPFVGALRSGPRAQPTTLIYLYRREEDAAFVDELRTLAATDPQLTLKARACGDDLPDFGELLAGIAGLRGRQVQICGPRGMVQALKAQLKERGLPAESIHFESFDFR